MKYTVVIQQPVAVVTRQVLEKQLMERFGLSGDQAQRLSARRAGRLMKPTSRTRAELLLSVFQSVGADVSLEEVREETGLLSEPFQGVPTPKIKAAPAPSTHDDAPLAPLLAPSATEDLFRMPAAIWPDAASPLPGSPRSPTLSVPQASDWDDVPLSTATAVLEPPFVPGLGTTSPAPNPLGRSGAPSRDMDFNLPGFDPFPESASSAKTATSATDFSAPDLKAPQTPAVGSKPASGVAPEFGLPKELLGGLSEGTSPRLASPTDSADRPRPAPNLAAPDLAAPDLAAPDRVAPDRIAPTPVRAPSDPLTTTDVWTDFTGSLTMTDSPASPDPKITSITPVLVPAVNDERGAPRVRRSSLARQLTLGTLAPLALSSALTLGLLSLSLPTVQRQAALQNANTLAATIGANLSGSNQGAQLDNIIRTANVGFVRVELPNGTTYLRTRGMTANDDMNRQISTWLKSTPDQGNITVGGTNYVASRLSFAADPAGKLVAVSNAAPTFTHRVTVGLPNAQSFTALRNTLLLVLGVSLLGLLLAALLAARSARQIIQPIERLVKVADAISMGDLTRPVQAERHDEIGDLAQALERMRLSLEAAMERLRRRQKRS